MATTIKVGQSLPLSIEYLDQSGNPMLTAPMPDAAPQWAQTSPSAESLTASFDGHTATAIGLAPGDDTVDVKLSVGGRSFSASLGVSVAAAAGGQTLTSIAIIAGTPTP